jgi:pimeloyl-ACP methyl ester carboxylesterase
LDGQYSRGALCVSTDRPLEALMFGDAKFSSHGVVLRGRLYRDSRSADLRPAVVMAHGFSATITMVVDRYAEVFADAGFVVLLYDHAGFGISDGAPRQVINPWLQACGYRDALSYLSTVEGVDPARMAVWGDSLSAAVAIVVAAIDERVAAVVAQVPACGRRPAPEDPDGALFGALRRTLVQGDVTESGGANVGPLPVVSADQFGTPSLLTPISAFRWFIEYGGRHGSGWENSAIRVTPDTPAPFHPGLCTPRLRIPSLWLLAPEDEMPAANPAVARQVYENAGGDKQLLEIGGGHFGLLHWPSEQFDLVATVQRDFLKQVLMR